jgi:bis(5'-adenosyl)-triphosphatase
MADCPFCDENGDIAIVESTDWLALYNRKPLTDGHCLVVPRQHVTALTSLSSSQVASYFSFAADVSRIVVAAYDTDQFDWALQHGPDAGQTVEHLHLHVIPRKAGDLRSPGSWYEELTGHSIVESERRTALSRDEMRKQVRKITAHLLANI